MMTGYLAAQGVCASEVRVGRTLAQMHEPYHQARCQVDLGAIVKAIIIKNNYHVVRKDPAGTIQWRQSFRG